MQRSKFRAIFKPGLPSNDISGPARTPSVTSSPARDGGSSLEDTTNHSLHLEGFLFSISPQLVQTSPVKALLSELPFPGHLSHQDVI